MHSVNSASVKYYNANDRNRNTGDCVIRSLTLAYDMPYSDVRRELIGLGGTDGTWNRRYIYHKFISSHGYVDHGKPERGSITLEEFADSHPSGTWLVQLERKAYSNQSGHIVCLEDGNVWDTWNSLGWFVEEWWEVKEQSSQISSNIDTDALDQISSVLSAYCTKIQKKMPWAYVYISSKRVEKDGYTGTIVARVSSNEKYAEMYKHLIDSRSIRREFVKTLRLVIKFHPKLSYEQNIKNTSEKARVQLREWAYQIRKVVEDEDRAYRVVANPSFHGDRILLSKMPEWARPKIISLWDYSEYGSSWYGDRYSAEMEADPEDPRYETNKFVSFSEDTLKELIHDMEMYRSDFKRLNYDY